MKTKRDKKFIGAIISAVESTVGGINAQAEERDALAQQAQQLEYDISVQNELSKKIADNNRTLDIQNQNNKATALNQSIQGNEYIKQYRNRFSFKNGGVIKRPKKSFGSTAFNMLSPSGVGKVLGGSNEGALARVDDLTNQLNDAKFAVDSHVEKEYLTYMPTTTKKGLVKSGAEMQAQQPIIQQPQTMQPQNQWLRMGTKNARKR